MEYDAAIKSAELLTTSFQVAGRTVTGVFASTSANPADRAAEGRFAIITLSPEDENAPLAGKAQAQGGGPASSPPVVMAREREAAAPDMRAIYRLMTLSTKPPRPASFSPQPLR